MKILDFYQELWPKSTEASLGKIKDFVRDAPAPNEEDIVCYLIRGHEIFSVMGVSGDLLGSDYEILAGDSIMTDGEWIWRKSLWFYVSRYHISLPGEFTDKVRAYNYEVPFVPESLLDELATKVTEIW